MDPAVAALKKLGMQIDSINVQTNTDAIGKYNIRSVPTFIYYLNREEVRRASGNMSTAELRQLWRKPLF
jgi:hypothetical protein